ncbi:hypothetical protein FQR65_LT13189 [Abscondita terminalis]|nr:hypothetical protein FQR65_LT13189 [Abscondita terminalis]
MWVIALITIFVVVYYFLWSSFQYWNKRKVPHPVPSLLFGNIGASLILKRSVGQILTDIYNDFPGYLYVGYYKIRKPGLILRDPQLIRDVLGKDFNSFHDNDFEVDEDVDPIGARNTFVLKGDHWKIVKNQISPCFTSKKLKAMYVLVEDAAKKLMQYLENESDKCTGDGFESRELFAKYSTEVVASCAFGLEGNTFTEPDPIFRKMGKKIFDPTFETVCKMYVLMLMPSLTKYLKIGFLSRPVCDYFLGVVRAAIKYREDNKVIRNDFLDFMIELKNKKGEYEFTDVDITAQAVGFFTDGFETSSAVMSYTVHELAANRNVLEKLYSEIEEAFTQRNGHLDFDSISELKYLDAVINESLRMHPPGIALQRVCTQPFTFPPPQGIGTGKELKVEVGTPVMIPVYGLHYDPKYFTNPYTFNPDRFLPENKDTIVKGTFLPFGEGGRSCHGQRFAIMQIKVLIVNLLFNFDVKVGDKTKLPLEIDPRYLVPHAKATVAKRSTNYRLIVFVSTSVSSRNKMHEKVLRIPESLLQQVQCVLCKRCLSCSPLRMLSDGSTQCGRCASNDGSRAIALEAILSIFTFSCTFYDRGCMQSIRFNEAKEHEALCVYRSFSCPLSSTTSCDWIGPFTDFFNHFQNEHNDRIWKHSVFKVEIEETSQDAFMCVKESATFFIRYAYNGPKMLLSYEVCYCTSETLSPTYNIQLLNVQDRDCNISLKSRKCKQYSDYHDSFENFLNLNQYVKNLENPSTVEVSLSFHQEVKNNCVNHNDLNSLKCVDCCNYLIPPVYDLNEHVVCSDCGKRNPHCVLSTNNKIKALVANGSYPCRWRKCKDVLKSDEYKLHELNCKHRHYDCFFPTCKITFKIDAAVEHLQSHRATHMTDRISYKTTFEQAYNFKHLFTVKDNVITVVQYNVTENEGNLTHRIALFSSNPNYVMGNVDFEHNHCKLKSKLFLLVSDHNTDVNLNQLPPCFKYDDELQVTVDILENNAIPTLKNIAVPALTCEKKTQI